MTDEEVPTERVTMVWPKTLKQAVREKAGQRGMTEYIMEATQLHLGVSANLDETLLELNRTKHLTQLLADRLVMGGEHDDRLQALMEVELPEWIDTTGWPAPMAELVKPAVVEAVEPTAPLPGDPVVVAERVPAKTPPPAVEPEPEPGEATTSVPEPEVQTPVETPAISADRDDLFAKVMAKTGGKLSDVPGLTVASAVVAPVEKSPVDGPIEPLEPQEAEALEVMEEVVEIATSTTLCPSCKEEMVDGECWTCA